MQIARWQSLTIKRARTNVGRFTMACGGSVSGLLASPFRHRFLGDKRRDPRFRITRHHIVRHRPSSKSIGVFHRHRGLFVEGPLADLDRDRRFGNDPPRHVAGRD